MIDCMTKFGQLSTLKITYFYLGPRSAWDTVEIGPYRTIEQAKAGLVPGAHTHWENIVQERTVEGLEALRIFELFEDKTL